MARAEIITVSKKAADVWRNTDAYNQAAQIIDMLVEELEAPTLTPPNEPLTQAQLDKMHFDKVWIDYRADETGERCGEEGVVLYGALYCIDALDGAGLEELLLDATGHGGDTLDNPSGNYTVYRRPPEGEADGK